ncbi:MAG: efflux RND transporter periplasmic adaptor subunit [Bacteroidales bacterium]|nr:efflux RND transporter periplasmic adaptor subunit [Bacteroidales bacterium]
MKKNLKYIILALVAIVFVGTFAALWKNSRPKEVKYEHLEATVKDIRKTSVVTGKIIPRDEVNIKPQISGIISELYKQAGEKVSEGEVIAKVKVIPEMSSLSAAQSRVRLAEINLGQAQTNFDREKALFDKNLVSAEEYDQVRQALSQAKEEKNAAVESLEVVRDGVSKSNAKSSSTLIRSTISGLILDVPVKVGNSVIQSNTFNDGTTIATVANMGDLIFDGFIDETEVGRVCEGVPMSITVGALRDIKFDAVMEYISPKAQEKNGTNEFEIKAAVTVPDSVTVRSGYSANAEIQLEGVYGVLSIPESALTFTGDSTFVYLVKGEKKYEKIPVVTGLSDGINIEVKSGLKEGDKVRGNQIIEKK